nr:hypothetical protein [Tanacetum cinerariifolium]
MDSIEQCIVERVRHEQELQNGLKRLNERELQIQKCKVQEVKALNANSRYKDCSRIVSEKGNDQGLKNQSNTSRDESSRSRNECNNKSTSGDDTDIIPSYNTEPMVEVPYTAEYNVFAVDTQHSNQHECISNTCVVETGDNNVILDSRIFTPHSWPQVRKLSFAKTYDVNAPGPSRNRPKHVSFQSPKESVGSNDMVHNYYLEEAKKKAQLQKDKALDTKPSVQQSARLPNIANGNKPKPRNFNQQPKNWPPSMSSRVVHATTKEVLSPFKNPEQKFRSKSRLFDTPSLVESNAPEFNRSFDIEEQSEEGE